MADNQNQKTGIGSEATEGIHAADRGGRNEEDNTSLEAADIQADGDRRQPDNDRRRGSEPTTSHSTEHKSSYGGGGPNGGMK